MAYVGVGGEGCQGLDLGGVSNTKDGMSSSAKISSKKITSNANHYLSCGWLTGRR